MKNDKNELSPMMQKYFEIKGKYQDCLLFFRLGDFYEMFFEDAVTASKVLELTLTGRDCGLEERAPMCGVPYHAVDTYVAKLIENGYKVAICEQLNSPNDTKGMLERDVTRVITPGTVIEENILDNKKNNYIASVFNTPDKNGIAWADISTGEFYLLELENNVDLLQQFLVAIHPSEIIANRVLALEAKEYQYVKNGDLPKFFGYFDWAFEYGTAYERICKQLNVSTLQSYECEDKKTAIGAAGALTEYLHETQKRALVQINKISYVSTRAYMLLDVNTKRNLELTESMRDKKKYGSLLWVLDKTSTCMGARKMRKWIEQPLQDCGLINDRLDSVEELINDALLRNNSSELLDKIRDIERLCGKIAYGSVNPKDCIAIRESLFRLPKLKQSLANVKSKKLKRIKADIVTLDNIADLLEKAIDDDAPALIKDGGYIKSGYDKELDELKNASKNGADWLNDLEKKERESTGIKNLKIGYNKVFGYYIEVSNSNLNQVPYYYQRKQTLTNGERFITDDLKRIEDTILGANEKALRLEYRLFTEIRAKLEQVITALQQNANAVSELDCLISLAKTAVENNYVKPKINNKVSVISIKNGRHPVVEKLVKSNRFIPNDTLLDDTENRMMIITGPNMAGKSTYMRQVALLTLLAHIGSYVPAEYAEIPLTDRIFTRVGASDDLIFGQSTFMVEMLEVATILNNATSKSLLVLDEIGRGTSTYDGLSIAWAVVEYVSNHIKAKTLFATHYHELTELENTLQSVKNYRITVKEFNDSVIFLYKIARGGANKSFGIEVASLAGVPQIVLKRAKEILKSLETADINRDTNAIMLGGIGVNKGKQIGFLDGDTEKDKLINEIKDIDIDNCTPMQAISILQDLIIKSKKC